MTHSGEYGGKVLRGFKGDGMSFVSGAILTPDVVMSWPLGNRQALHRDGKVDWFGPPSEAEASAREAGSPAPKRGQVGANKKAPAKTAEEPATPSRRKRQ